MSRAGLRRLVRRAMIATTVCAFAQGPAPAAVWTPDRPLTNPASVASPSWSKRDASSAAPAQACDVGDGAWGTDGGDVFLAAPFAGSRNIWRVPLDGVAPVRIAPSGNDQTDVAVFPDGQHILFSEDVRGDETYRLLIAPAAGGAPSPLVEDADGAQWGPRISPDGKSVALSYNRPGSANALIAVADVATRRMRVLTPEEGSGALWSAAAWTPDGRFLIANVVDTVLPVGGIRQLDLASGEVVPLGPRHGLKLVSAADISPDGKVLAVTSVDRRGLDRAGLMDRATGRIRWVSASTWGRSSVRFIAGGRRLLLSENVNGEPRLSSVGLGLGDARGFGFRTGTTEIASQPVPPGPGVIVRHSSGTLGENLWAIDARGAARRLTSCEPLDAAAQPFRSRTVTYAAPDGTRIGAVLTVPSNLRRDRSHPAVVLIHGGPDQAKNNFDARAAALATHGYLVLQPNYRGSTGYGKPFETGNLGAVGEADLGDVLAAPLFLAATGYVDPRRVGVAGESYGGYLALMALGRQPSCFAAGVDMFGITDLRSLLQSASPLTAGYLRGLLGGLADDATALAERSPLTHAAAIRSPILLMQGESDIHVPAEQTRAMANRLQALGKAYEAVFYAGEGHGFRLPETQSDAMRRALAWFDEHLGHQDAPRPEPACAAPGKPPGF